MVTAFLLPLLVSQADQVIARNSQYQSAFNTLSVRVEVQSSKIYGKGVGKLILKRPQSSSFEMTWDQKSYSVFSNGAQAIEFDHSQRVYAETDPTGTINLPDSQISMVPEYGVPAMLFQKSIKQLFPPKAKYTYIKKEKRGGVSTDHILVSFSNDQVDLKVNIWFDDKGALREYRSIVVSPGGTLRMLMKLSQYSVNQPVSDSMFIMEPPSGYTPHRFSDRYAFPQTGSRVSVPDFVDRDTGKATSLVEWLKGKPAVIAVVDDAPASSELIKWLSSDEVTVQSLITNQSATEIKSTSRVTVVSDTEGRFGKALRAPGAPLWVLVDGNGAVVQFWYGFDSDKIETYKKQLLEKLGG